MSKLYKGFNYGNYHNNTNKWLKSIYDEDVLLERTPDYIHQSNNPDMDYIKYLSKAKLKYDAPKVTVLVKNGEALC